MKKVILSVSMLFVLGSSSAFAAAAPEGIAPGADLPRPPTSVAAPVRPVATPVQTPTQAPVVTNGKGSVEKALADFFGKKVCIEPPKGLTVHVRAAAEQAKRVRALANKLPPNLRAQVLKLVDQVKLIPKFLGKLPEPGEMHTMQGTLQSCRRSTNDN